MGLGILDSIPTDLGEGGKCLAPGDGAGKPALVDILIALGKQLSKRTVTLGHADLTNAVNGSAETELIGAVLPANSRILGVDLRAYTPFTGGGATAVTVDIGTSGDIDAIVDGADVFAAAVDGGPATIPPGIRPNKMFATAGAQLIATFVPDGAHALLGLTAGSITIDVFYMEAD